MTFTRLPVALTRLRSSRRGVAMTEFALVAPVLLLLGTCGIEMANYALVRMLVSQININVADNISRVGLDSGLSVFQVSEGDANDTFAGAAISGSALDVLANGRIIISSLEQNASGGQWIHWQRCKGAKTVVSDYGAEGTGATGTSFPGMGPSTARVTAPTAAIAVMYAETTYDYQPLFPFLWADAPTGALLGSIFNNTLKTIKYGNSFMIRDNRDLNQDTARNSGRGIFNFNNPLTGQPAPQSLCTTYSAS